MSFFNELKRRNVFRVGAAYLVVAWLLIQIVVSIESPLNLPAWFDTVVIVLLGIGFPLALLLAWAFELTPEGLKRTHEVDVDTSITQQTGKKLNTLIISVLVLAVIFLVTDNYILDQSPPTQERNVSANVSQTPDLEMSIAVLPFSNLSGDPEQEYFSDGLTDEMINKLSRVQDLLVTGRNSAFYFKGRETELDEIRETLGVNYLLQGSVRKGNETFRINAQLLNLQNNRTLWSQSYDREFTDVLAVQDDIARKVTTALSLTLRAGEFARPGMTSNTEAYDALLRLEKMYSDLTDGNANVQDVIEYAEQVVQIDPDFALAWFWLWKTYLQARIHLPVEQTPALQERANFARDKIRELEPALPELILADVQFLEDTQGDWASAEEQLLMLLDKTGGTDLQALNLYIQFLESIGRAREALPLAKQARLRDPLNADVSIRVQIGYLLLGRVQEALEEINHGIRLDDGLGGYFIGNRLMAAFIENDKESVREIMATEGYDFINTELVEAWSEDNNDAALTMLRNLIDNNKNPTFIERAIYSHWAVVLGDPELAMDLTAEIPIMGAVPWLPIYDDFRKLPEFKQLLRKFGVVDYWRATGNWNDYCRPLAGSDDFECF